MKSTYLDSFVSQFSNMSTWIDAKQQELDIPIYSSVDVRDSGFKVAIVDTNLFPAGFNNIAREDWDTASALFKTFIKKRHPHSEQILIVSEEHTRNPWYIDHLICLKSILESAGFLVEIATFLNPDTDEICKENHWITLESATFGVLHVRCIGNVLSEYHSGSRSIDLLLYNNDLSEGLPDRLKTLPIPAYPTPLAGWYARRKSMHFTFLSEISLEFSKVFKLDPWLISALFDSCSHANINEEADRHRLLGVSEPLYQKIKEKYAQHHISAAPTLFLKSDSGTYGMGVVPLQDAQEVLHLNRKARNNLSKGKNAISIHDFLIQEGVSTSISVSGQVAEPCLYLVNNQVAGAFYRLNNQKSLLENLNSQGMSFQPISLAAFQAALPDTFHAYCILARLAGLAAAMELTYFLKLG